MVCRAELTQALEPQPSALGHWVASEALGPESTQTSRPYLVTKTKSASRTESYLCCLRPESNEMYLNQCMQIQIGGKWALTLHIILLLVPLFIPMLRFISRCRET